MKTFTQRAITAISLACMTDDEIAEHYTAEMQYWAHNLTPSPLRDILRAALRHHMDKRSIYRTRIDASANRARARIEAEQFIINIMGAI